MKLTEQQIIDLHAGKEVTIEDAGGSKKGMKLPQLGGLDPVALWEVSKVSGYGSIKYGRTNYLQSGYDYSLSFDAMLRHIMRWLSGEDYDQESKCHHLAHAAWHCMALISFQQRGIGNDDRFEEISLDQLANDRDKG